MKLAIQRFFSLKAGKSGHFFLATALIFIWSCQKTDESAQKVLTLPISSPQILKIDNKSVENFGRQCEENDARACVLAAKDLCELDADGNPHNCKDESQKYAVIACNLDLPEGCRLLTYMILNYETTNLDMAVRTNVLSKSCDLGDAKACMRLADSECTHDEDDNADPDDFLSCEPAAIPFLHMACDNGEPRACNRLCDVFYHSEGTSPNQIKERACRKKSCELNDYDACGKLGLLLDNGVGGDDDPSLARNYYDKACKSDWRKNCFELGDMWLRGHGGERNMTKARQYFAMACDGEVMEGCYNLAQMELMGLGGKSDKFSSWEHFDQACGQHTSVCFNEAVRLFSSLNAGKSRIRIPESKEEETIPGKRFFADIMIGRNAPLKQINRIIINYFGKLCAQNDAAACFNLGELWENSKDFEWESDDPASIAKSRRYYDKACSLKNTSACSRLGSQYSQCLDCEGSSRKAREYYKRACDLGDAFGCMELAETYRDSVDGSTEHPEAVHKYLKMGCDLSSPEACKKLAMAWQDEEPWEHRDNTNARLNYAKACHFGDMDACIDLGTLLNDSDDGIERDRRRAIEYFKLACSDDCYGYICDDGGNDNDSHACYMLGKILATPDNTSDDLEVARTSFVKACDLGRGDACLEAGKMYISGVCFDYEIDRARDLFKLACDGREAEGCFLVGKMYETGNGVRKDLDDAIDFYRKSCSSGNASVCSSTAWNMVDADSNTAIGFLDSQCIFGRNIPNFKPRMCEELAWMSVYANKDTASQVQYFRQVCGPTNSRACIELAALLMPKLPGEAQNLANEHLEKTKAACATDALSCLATAELYQTMNDCPNYEAFKTKARALFTEACENNEAMACKMKAWM